MRTYFLVALGLFLLMTTIPQSATAQQRAAIKGIVTDMNNAPVSFVTIRVYREKDSTQVIQTSYTKEDGKFSFGLTVPGNYSMVFTHIAHDIKKQKLSLQPGSNVELGSIQLSPKSGTLNNVVITSQRPLVEQNDDKIVFNVEDDPAAKTETAIDILRKTPFVSVDGEDNILINGKSNFRVLLNGKETSMFAKNVKEALRAFPGAMISKIEVITTPSAKYDGEGIGGLINIITKKKVVGYNGNVSSFARTIDKMTNLSLNGNAKFGKVGVTAFYNMGRNRPVDVGTKTTTIPTDPYAYTMRELEGKRNNANNWAFGNAEISIELDSLNTISAYSNLNSHSGNAEARQTVTTTYTSAPSDISYLNTENENENPGVSVGTDYIRKFKKNKESELSFRFFGEFGEANASVNSEQLNPGTDRYMINQTKANNDQYTLQTDYILPVKKGGRIESGVKAILRRASSDFESLVKYDPAHDYKPNPSNTDEFSYHQDVISVYSMYNFKIKKNSIRIGARVEYTDVDGDFVSSQTVVKQNYTTLLPNIQVTRKFSNIFTMVAAYTKRLQRPYIQDLNPFVFDNDSLNISYGNPDLGPQLMHSISLQNRYTKGNTFAAINLEGTYSDTKIMQYSEFDPLTGVTKTTSLNIGKEYQASMNLNLNTKVTPEWRIFVNTSLRYRKIINNTNAEEENSGFGGNITMNTSYTFSKTFNISSFVGFFREPVNIQTTYPLYNWYNVALNKKIFKEKLNVSARFINFFEKTRDFETITKNSNFTTSNINTQIRRGFALALTYNFGKLSENVSKKKGVNNDDLLTQPQVQTGQ